MSIPASLIKQLRDRTNAGFLECKKALEESQGDIDAAIEYLKKVGQAKAVKRSARVAAEGTIVVLITPDNLRALLLDVSSETDFVSRDSRFQEFARMAADLALKQNIRDLAELQSKCEAARIDLATAMGENIAIRRLAFKETKEGVIGAYGHGDANGVRIGTLVVLKKGPAALARDIAMHVAAMNPEYLTASDIPAARLEKEKEIFIEQTRQEGKPDNMLEKIAEGKLKKYKSEATLLGQPFVKQPDKSIEALLKEQNAEIESFVRFEVGEGIEKKQENFAAEVMAQVKGAEG